MGIIQIVLHLFEGSKEDDSVEQHSLANSSPSSEPSERSEQI